MTAFRTSIPQFGLANPIYVGAKVTFYTVDGSGNATTTPATLYADPAGTTTVNNPQTLDGYGKFAAPVYIAVPVIGSVVGPNVGSHTTGIIGSPLPSSTFLGIAAEFALLAGSSGTISIPAGVTVLAAQVVLTLAAGQSVAIVGAGQYSTVLKWPNAAGGLQINYNGPNCGVQISDLCFITSQAAGGDAIKLNQSGTLLGNFNLSTVSRCAFQGDDLQTTRTHYWSNGVNVLGVSGVNVEDCICFGDGTHGIGTIFAGTGAGALYAIVGNVRGSAYFGTATGVRMGAYMQGLTVDQCTFTNGVVGVDTPAGAGGTLAQLNITDSEFDVTGDQVQLNTIVAGFFCEDCLLFVKTSKSGIAGLASNVTITGNQFSTLTAPAGTGVNLTATFFAITGNIFNGIKTAIDVLPTSAFGTVNSNTLQSGTVTATLGIKIEGSAVGASGNTINGFGTGIQLAAASSSCTVDQTSNLITNCTSSTTDAGTSNVVSKIIVTGLQIGPVAPAGNNLIQVNIASATGRFIDISNTLGEAQYGVDSAGSAYAWLATGTGGTVFGTATACNVDFFANNIKAVSIVNGADLAHTQLYARSTQAGVTAATAGLRADGSVVGASSIVSLSPTAGIGYAAGAGGAVTQATSKSTTAVLNTATGAITMNNAALAAATIVSFTLTNSAIAANDTLVLNHISGGTPGSYGLNARAAGGSATIDVRNNTAGSLSEAIVIQFTLIKGATS